MHPAVLMSDNDRFHCFKVDYADRAITRALHENHITQDDALLISTFIAERKITNNISIRRAQEITSNQITFRRGKSAIFLLKVSIFRYRVIIPLAHFR